MFISLKHDTVPRVNNLYAPQNLCSQFILSTPLIKPNFFTPQKYSQFPWQRNILPTDLTWPDLWPDLQAVNWPDLTWPVTRPATWPDLCFRPAASKDFGNLLRLLRSIKVACIKTRNTGTAGLKLTVLFCFPIADHVKNEMSV